MTLKNGISALAVVLCFGARTLRANEDKTMAKQKKEEAAQSDSLRPQLAASRGEPAATPPIKIASVRYESVWGSIGKFRAVDDKSGKELWALQLYHGSYNDNLETDVQDVFIRSMKKESDDLISLEDEIGRVYQVDLKKRSSRIAVWPVALRLSALEPLSVEVVIRNTLDRTVSLDEPSVAVGGQLQNNLFRVKADGKDVRYQGKMKSRVPPDSFLELKPQGEYRQVVDLSQAYAIAPKIKLVEVVFAHHNHFSKDGFDLLSRPLLIELIPQKW